MSAVRDYLEAKAALGDGEWMRREPRETHPEILALVREFQAAGGFYDDDAERFVGGLVGDLPAHWRHGHDERDPLTYQLGHEVYLAKSILRDEAAQARLDEALAEGYVPLDEAAVEDGGRYALLVGIAYSGRKVPEYPPTPIPVRAKRDGDRLVFLPHRARTRGVWPSGPALIRSEA